MELTQPYIAVQVRRSVDRAWERPGAEVRVDDDTVQTAFQGCLAALTLVGKSTARIKAIQAYVFEAEFHFVISISGTREEVWCKVNRLDHRRHRADVAQFLGERIAERILGELVRQRNHKEAASKDLDEEITEVAEVLAELARDVPVKAMG